MSERRFAMDGVSWKAEPDKHDYPAAASYLSLIAPEKRVQAVIKRLKKAPIAHYKAKDILRASGLELLGPDNKHVAADLGKISRDQPLSPVLLIRGDVDRAVALQIVDGYHRVCASYHVDENTDIPCRVIDLPDWDKVD